MRLSVRVHYIRNEKLNVLLMLHVKRIGLKLEPIKFLL
jgi:hypothetical protein